MAFNSLGFFAFFCAALLVHHLPLSWRLRKINLLVMSLLFYSLWYAPWVLVLLATVTIDYLVGLRLGSASGPVRRKLLVALSLTTNLGCLAVFKFGLFPGSSSSSWYLPIGISFYTFHSLSYVLDLYKGRSEPCRSFPDFALYVSFFPQLIAGPIMRAHEFLPQCERPGRTRIAEGMAWLAFGLFMKITLADGIFAPASDVLFSRPTITFAGAWLGSIAFAGRIFCDFCGYSICAIGAGLCMGFRLRENFRSPYAAIGFSDFWRRWHITLSTWFRDYVYIPLGGSRSGRARNALTLMTTMLLAAFWHGASWTFIAWGALHGVYLLGERGLKNLFNGAQARMTPALQAAAWLITFLLTCLSWVFFRATDMNQALAFVSAMFRPDTRGFGLPAWQVAAVLITMIAVLSCQLKWKAADLELIAGRAPRWAVSVALAGMIALTFLSLSNNGYSFVYFRF